ncbi:MAG TPA: DEAD/DEAH box helicase [Candidatus Methylomirabilis sp.]|nr:DEAD/DEAH box helicase [Candidatus Methylomirabilis sp.]
MNPSAPDTIPPQRFSEEDQRFLEAFRQRYPFPLDPFQEQAIRHILRGESVIVSAPTGAGKTLIAEFAIYRALAVQRRVIYTTPLKALSNQKFADFSRQYGSELTGILTGDVKVNPQAPILIMTTEIFRNLLFTEEPEDVASAVLDECHYLGDEGRGTVWEEIVINCPATIQLVALSATVSNVQDIAAWIGETHGPIHSVHHPLRPVPLQYLLCHQDGEIIAPEGPRRARAFTPEVRIRGERRWQHRANLRERGRRHPASPSRVIPQLQERRWLPAIYFIFSRSGCERALRRFLEDGGSLLDRDRREEVEEAIANTLRDYPSIMPETEVNSLLLDGLNHGAGLHHAGVLPALKRLVEVLFERGLVKVVFATETMSLGIHMPAKSVVIQGIRKRTDIGFRQLTVNELTQMAGRAGRRGIDPEGKCLIGLDAPEAEDEVRQLLEGQPEPIQSRFRVGYSSAALLVDLYRDPAAVRRVIESSFGQYQNRQRIQVLERERAELLAGLAKAEGISSPCCDLTDLLAYREKRAALEAARERARRSGLGEKRSGRRRGQAAGPAMEGWSESLHQARQRLEAMALELSQMPCHRCPHRGKQERQLKRFNRILRMLEGRERALRELRQSYWEQFLRVVEVLRYFGYLTDSKLSPEGRLIASLRHDNELLVARVAFSGLLEGLEPAEAMALLSCLVEEPRELDTHHARELLRRVPHLRRRVQSLEALAHDVGRVQQSGQIHLPVSMHVTYLAVTYEWTAGEEDWVRLIRNFFGGHEGDLIRAFRRLIDLGRQLIDSPDLPGALRTSLTHAVKLVDRGIVLESALI